METVVFIFCSITPEQYEPEVNKIRVEEYNRSLQQLRRLCPYDMHVFDNTEFSKGHDIIKHIPENIGTVNKGLGELSMLKYACDNGFTKGYKKVCYVTGRHLWICPYFFHRVKYMQTGILVGNPDFMYINGVYHEVEKKEMYNDMAFCMYRELMEGYANYIDFSDQKIGSEQWLYRYVHSKPHTYELIEHLGLIRNDWQKTGNYIDLANYHGV